MYEEVLHFWFDELEPTDWFAKDDNLDATIVERFSGLHKALATKQKVPSLPSDYLAASIVLDQFSRNMFRGTDEAFLYDKLARTLARDVLDKKIDEQFDDLKKQFFYMPFMHSENITDHIFILPYFESLSLPQPLKYELLHKEIIENFGRYPHRNAVLGRTSTPEEISWLESNAGF